MAPCNESCLNRIENYHHAAALTAAVLLTKQRQPLRLIMLRFVFSWAKAGTQHGTHLKAGIWALLHTHKVSKLLQTVCDDASALCRAHQVHSVVPERLDGRLEEFCLSSKIGKVCCCQQMTYADPSELDLRCWPLR